MATTISVIEVFLFQSAPTPDLGGGKLASFCKMTTKVVAAVSLFEKLNGPDCEAISRSFCHVSLAAPFDYLGFLSRWRLQRRTPGPPPFSSMNSTPARFKGLSKHSQGRTDGISLAPPQIAGP